MLWNRKNYTQWIFSWWIMVAISTSIRSWSFIVHICNISRYTDYVIVWWWAFEVCWTTSFELSTHWDCKFFSPFNVWDYIKRPHEKFLMYINDMAACIGGGKGVHCVTSTTVITIQFASAPHNMITFGMKWWWSSV